MFKKWSIEHYDRIYGSRGKDYPKEAAFLLELVRDRGVQDGGRLLDVACGTGLHLMHFKHRHRAEGIDISPAFAARARVNNPDLTIRVGDMRRFSLPDRYEVITCLFSAIGYMTTMRDLNRAIRNMGRHLAPGGLLLVEPWFGPGDWMEHRPSMTVVDEPDLKVARVNTSWRRGRVSCFDLHYLVGTPGGVTHFVEKHRAGLFTVDEMKQAFTGSGMTVAHDPEGPSGRGLYIGRV
jgi:SAM-dependent methyltransferase